MTVQIYSDEPHRGWLPWVWLAPFVGVFLIAVPALPFDLVLERLGATDAHGDPTSAAGFCLMLILPFSAMAAAVLAWTRWVERRGLETLGLLGTDRRRNYLRGLAAGLAMMGLAVLLIRLAGGYQAEEGFPAFASPRAMLWIAALFLGFMVQAGIEELIFRGWLLSSITRRWNLAAGFIGSSLAFTIVHLSPDQPLRVTALSFLFGLFACAWARRENGIWGVMGWHASWNWLGGVGFDVPITGLDVHLPALIWHLVPVGPDYLNGGAEGPEGSVFTIGLLVVAAAILLVSRTRASSNP